MKKSNSLRIPIWCIFFYCTCSYFTALLDITVVSSYRNQQLFVGLSQYLRNCFNSHTSLNKFVLLYCTRRSFHFVNVCNTTCQPPWSVSRINYIDKERVRSYFNLKCLIFSPSTSLPTYNTQIVAKSATDNSFSNYQHVFGGKYFNNFFIFLFFSFNFICMCFSHTNAQWKTES